MRNVFFLKASAIAFTLVKENDLLFPNYRIVISSQDDFATEDHAGYSNIMYYVAYTTDHLRIPLKHQ